MTLLENEKIGDLEKEKIGPEVEKRGSRSSLGS
jgi:hypothetical protein